MLKCASRARRKVISFSRNLYKCNSNHGLNYSYALSRNFSSSSGSEENDVVVIGDGRLSSYAASIKASAQLGLKTTYIQKRGTFNVGPISSQVLGCSETSSWGSQVRGISYQIHHERNSMIEEELDPFSLVADELSIVANRLRAMVVAEVPKLASAAEYFFKMGVEGKRFRPTVLLLMASAFNIDLPKSVPDGVTDSSPSELRTRQQCIAEITEMIHVSS
ncbi:Solanesyl diphosphate synthase [Thalictrum thalictroides]|uniref:Solanesyl diphosphate synthase n=1 Tax=Thalictrum thalictroides TaxID=46969 RepID=A0A7J6WYE2_THATH|nr:Solanesyl diphosphate synthase [Thalictrum thalictroides]